MIIADGKTIPSDGKGLECKNVFDNDRPYEPWSCAFGATQQECKAALEEELHRQYAGMNIDFRFTKPESPPYYRVFVAGKAGSVGSGRTWATCTDDYEESPLACVYCGRSKHGCGVTVAHEQAHMAGLKHSNHPDDIMYPVSNSSASKSFMDQDLSADSCRRTQNAYRYLLELYGPR